MSIRLNWSTTVHCQRTFNTAAGALNALGIDHDGDLTHEQAVELINDELERPGTIVADILDEWMADFAHGSEVDTDDVEAEVVA